ncbi:DUF1294 domain-containing protein [Enterobacillus tribolii]|uniref:Uncharacterized membrane protein YsdA (DUF1294 family) n=1 Tax=Enterobacillus tribolii TaxID=1487935 RepID=A0A370QS33_9GAMM|nr:DUF1294 domain-containing protein [Enterobacillus tribolii]MBW7983459.1 DUF1294 domain-containing protein [Enterobacillus tribolii]RDK92046.1 uncharacterized membrane protein YsdA (DUF1294 family) [Enterobacillus tribolii]
MLNKAFWLLLVVTLIASPFTPAPVIIGFLILNLLTLLAYGADKYAAIRERQRIPEKTLLLFGLFGGWPGALIARRLWRHKTRKQPFVALFWGCVAVNLVFVTAVLYWAGLYHSAA